ncbi:MAG: hypothetical protein Q8736_02655, partial [Sweet potato little leaf phytoplasma]|nr:hypothetical protein [Sweet potato little leaf phytoplasma]
MPYLLSIADRVTKYRSYCFICGKKASRTQRIYSNRILLEVYVVLGLPFEQVIVFSYQTLHRRWG